MEDLDVTDRLKIAIQSLSIAGAQTAFDEPKLARVCRSVAEALVTTLELRGGTQIEISMTEHAKQVAKHLREFAPEQ